MCLLDPHPCLGSCLWISATGVWSSDVEATSDSSSSSYVAHFLLPLVSCRLTPNQPYPELTSPWTLFFAGPLWPALNCKFPFPLVLLSISTVLVCPPKSCRRIRIMCLLDPDPCFVGLWRCLDVVGSSVLLCQELRGVTVTNGMWNKYDMTPSVAINATQLIAIEAATVRQRVNAGTAVHAHNIFLRHLGTFSTNTMVCCKPVSLNVVL
jgi:hypothetical protein